VALQWSVVDEAGTGRPRQAAVNQIDVDALRRATPGAESVVHLNNAGAALPSLATLDTVLSHVKLEAAFGGYEAAAMAAGAYNAVRVSAARLVGADATEIALTQSDSAGFTKAFWGLLLRGWFSVGDVVVVDALSYNSHHLALLQAKRLTGIDIVVEEAPELWPEETKLVAYTLIGTHGGHVRNLDGVGAFAKERDIPFFLDACQAVGQMPVDVEAIGCDVLTATGRKWLRGPRGTGFLYVREAWQEQMHPPGIDGASATWMSPGEFAYAPDALRFEEFEAPIAARLGLGTAIDETLALGVDAIWARVTSLAERLRVGLVGLGATVHDGDAERCAIVTFTVPNVDPLRVVTAAGYMEININSSTAEFARIDMDQRGLTRVVRASPHIYNTDEEIDRLLEVVASLG
jgi:cysteine desulfurase / selenocysteine lyase